MPQTDTITEAAETVAASANKGGAPVGNDNATSHGTYAVARTGRVPLCVRGGHEIRRRLRRMQREIVTEFVAVHNREPNLPELMVLHSLSRHEARASILENRLAHEGSTLTIPDFASILDKIGSATDRRDAAAEKLGLKPKPAADPRSALRAALAIPVAAKAVQPASGKHDPEDSHASAGSPETQPDANGAKGAV